MTLNQNVLLIVLGAIAVAVVAGCVTLMVMGHNEYTQSLVQIGIALIGAVVGVMVKQAHSENVANQAQIAKTVGADLNNKS